MTQHIFLHIPKTAGSSVRTLIQQNYPADATIGFSGDPEPLEWFASSDATFKARYRMVHGHFPFGIHAGLDDYTYFTFLRDPVERHFSDYFFLKRYEDHPLHESVASGTLGLADWAGIHETRPEYRELSTRRTSGDGDAREPDRCSLDRSKYLLATEFSFVGLAERFDESVLILARRLGWTSVFYLTKNVTAQRPAIDASLRDRAKLGLRLDLELHTYARRLFESCPELQDPSFRDALAEFREARAWLESHVASDPHALFVVGDDLPPLDDVVRRHRPLPRLDRFLAGRSRHAA